MTMFKKNHEIMPVIHIEVPPREHEVATTVQGDSDHILIQIWLIHQAGLWFPVNPLLKKVMAHCGLTFIQASINFVRTVLTIDTLMQ